MPISLTPALWEHSKFRQITGADRQALTRDLVPGLGDRFPQRGVPGQRLPADLHDTAGTSTSTPVTPASAPTSARTARAQWSQLIPVTTMERVSTARILRPNGLTSSPRSIWCDVRHFPNRWPALPGGRHEVVLHSPVHDAAFPTLGAEQAAKVVELWSARTAALGARDDVAYVFVFENRGRQIGSTIDHPHSQIMAFDSIPPIAEAELSAAKCGLCEEDPDDGLLVVRRSGWQAAVPWAPAWPYQLLISPHAHVPDLPTAGRELRAGLGAMLVDVLTRVERLLGSDAPYMLWIHQRPATREDDDWPAAHLHLHLAPAMRARNVRLPTSPPRSTGPTSSRPHRPAAGRGAAASPAHVNRAAPP